MLLFIPSATAVAVVRARFNTSHVTLYLYQFHSLKKLLLCFNTSHVTLYLLTKCEIRTFLNKFQYISCYSLSWYKTVYYPETITFQYISCYSLSPRKNSLSMGLVVSIHLMLLFIIGGNNIDLLISSFQYISCYSLSILVSAHMGARTGFQYISCYSLSKYCIQKLLQTEVSIHLMLLFIPFVYYV